MNQTILQVHAKAIEQLEAELGPDTGAGIQQPINTCAFFIRDESRSVGERNVPDKSERLREGMAHQSVHAEVHPHRPCHVFHCAWR